MKTPPLKKAIREYYEAVNLDDSQLAQLRDMAGKKPALAFPVKKSLLVAAILTSAIGFWAWWHLHTKQNTLNRILTEVANHVAQPKALDIRSQKMAEIQGALSKLEFALVDLSEPVAMDWELKGARYCSIDGIKAAQMRVIHKRDSQSALLYQVPLQSRWQSLARAPIATTRYGVRYQIWRDQGLLLILAAPDVSS